MEKKIIAVMVTLVVVAALVVAFVMVAAGGGSLHKAGGFTSLFDKLSNRDVNDTHDQILELPTSWEGDKVTVSDTIVDMSFTKATVNGLAIYTTHLWFTYMGTKWNQDPSEGTAFQVPMSTSYGGLSFLHVNHGSFELVISSATNISKDYHAGEVITLSSTVAVINSVMCFGVWTVANTL